MRRVCRIQRRNLIPFKQLRCRKSRSRVDSLHLDPSSKIIYIISGVIFCNFRIVQNTKPVSAYNIHCTQYSLHCRRKLLKRWAIVAATMLILMILVAVSVSLIVTLYTGTFYQQTRSHDFITTNVKT